MKIVEIIQDKKQYLDLLLLGDEQESMIDNYLDKGTMYALFDEDVKAICVVTDEGNGILEIKNIAVRPENQRKGYGRRLIQFLKNRYKGDFPILQVGTGDSPLTIPFYENYGFRRSHSVKNFFIDQYDHPIYECGKQLVDMIYLRMDL
ncbi:MAG: GNAT family N-acetyltransferase [Eubacteriales bacterium]|nr:GNAT family N-acetyltransferase [Eubacteriales bacterium]